jgi:uncharacterized protein YbaR (Trm112 family)
MQWVNKLLDIVVCPNCHTALALDHDHHELVCTNNSCQLAYQIQEGIPILIEDQARKPENQWGLGVADLQQEPSWQ